MRRLSGCLLTMSGWARLWIISHRLYREGKSRRGSLKQVNVVSLCGSSLPVSGTKKGRSPPGDRGTLWRLELSLANDLSGSAAQAGR